jgi:predicted alpha-1,2-mannosidase
MKKYFFLFLTFEFCLLTSAQGQRDYSKLVNPFIGTGGHGHTYPGASMPFGMMQLSPDTRMADWDGSSGYHYSDTVIYGFSHTHLSGTGIPDYCDVLMMPFDKFPGWEGKDYRSGFSHKNEKASPGYYSVFLDKYKVNAELTTTTRAGMHQYSFSKGIKTGSVIIDLNHRDKVLDANLEKINEYELRGYRSSRSWADSQTVYFFIRFQNPISEFVFKEIEGNGNIKSMHGKDVRAIISAPLNTKGQLLYKIGISGVSMEGAKKNLEVEMPGWDLNQIKKDAEKAWNKELGKIDVKGGKKDQQVVFYTALYHTMLSPNIYQDVDGSYRGTDLKVHKANGFTNYSVFSLWDTYRAYHPLMTILNQKRTGDWINTFLAQYKNGGMLPVWELSGNETFCMIGYHSIPVIWDAYQKGIRNFDHQLALKAMRDYAESNRFGLDHYRNHGYISNDKEHESVSKTLEYAYDDWCIAQFAKAIGKEDVYKTYIERAQYYKNLFDPSTRLFRGKLQGMWLQPFEPREINNFYTEGNAWHYGFAVPQDIETLINLHGGKDPFTKKLDELFSASSQTTGREQADVTGLIGQYAQGNEPSHHMAYLYAYAGKKWKTEDLVHKICNEFYKNSPDGLIGNEDCGQMSAWYVLSALGFYPVCPGSGEYVLGTPVFDKATIFLENGKKFSITAKRDKKNSFYVKTVELNKKDQNGSVLQHSDIMKGSSLNFNLYYGPKNWRENEKQSNPGSLIADHPITPVPYFNISKYKFRDSILVELKNIDPDAKIFLVNQDENDWLKNMLYVKPFYVSGSVTLTAFAEKNGIKSKWVGQQFYKLPTDKTINVSSKVHPLYTAGGSEALIDGITGTTNWRTGDWQSYFDTDFEATIDLEKIKPINYMGVHVLQDVSPWIVYPSEVVFYTSVDGKEYQIAGSVKNEIPSTEKAASVQELGINISTTARYIKVKAINGGKLPSWHESAGNPSHLFIDEVIVR